MAKEPQAQAIDALSQDEIDAAVVVKVGRQRLEKMKAELPALDAAISAAPHGDERRAAKEAWHNKKTLIGQLQNRIALGLG